MPILRKFSNTLQSRLQDIHSNLLTATPSLDRIACALYDARTDEISTFINSTRKGVALTAYHYKLSDIPSLMAIKESGVPRVVDRISEMPTSETRHSQWLKEQGYQSSFTAPMYDQNGFSGLIFFDSSQPNAFTETVQRDLLLYCSLINMTINSERTAVSAVLSSVKMARDFATLRDFETGGHLNRMSLFSEIIARGIAGECGLSDEFVSLVKLFAPLHDIGKIGIPDSILTKPGKLSKEEMVVMQTHVTKGENIARKILEDFDLERHADSQIMLNIVACHHEYLDGSGYPRGLRDADIPIEARIITVADIFDALTSPRPYKQPWSISDALQELDNMAFAGKLDIRCVNVLKYEQDAIHVIMTNQQDELQPAEYY